MIERKLSETFDLQRFVRNRRLQAIIDASHDRIDSMELSDEDLEGLAAAGESKIEGPKDRPR